MHNGRKTRCPRYTVPVAALTIRPAREEELPRLMQLQEASPQAAQWSEEHYRGAIDGSLSLRCLVAESGGRVQGMIVFRGPVGGESEILNLAVDPEQRRRGIGGALVRAASEQPTDLYLEVRRSNDGAIAFYRRCGFEEAGRRKDYYRDPPEDALVMKRSGGAPTAGL